MRSDLKAEGIAKIETDLDENTCVFEIAADADPKAMLDRLAESNSKIKDWSFIE
ncbi:hypothetical protein [Mariniblastus fucicola]|uniref:hypothetical protein n=1 Tax=Mariniblastus fucicola TaxID=980251 RepID=UPI0011DF10DE|nr:hypothetical protein [Mariniblastus fucicola]